jgi:adenylosuccinate synthase
MSNISHLKHCEAVYEEMPGWQASTRAARRAADLPDAARRYIARVSELSGAPVDIVSVGPEREETLWIKEPSLAGLAR